MFGTHETCLPVECLCIIQTLNSLHFSRCRLNRFFFCSGPVRVCRVQHECATSSASVPRPDPDPHHSVLADPNTAQKTILILLTFRPGIAATMRGGVREGHHQGEAKKVGSTD
jgi:hypothetical protein